MNKSIPVAARLSQVNFDWMKGKLGDKPRRGSISELIDLAVTEMRQGMEMSKSMRKRLKTQKGDKHE